MRYLPQCLVAVVLVIHLSSYVYGNPTHAPPKPVCGYEACPKTDPNLLNVHLVPHTHNDVGWLKTVDQYYYGSRQSIQNAGVQYILDSVIRELAHDPSKRFIYVETAFLWKWWMEQHDTTRHLVQKLVNNGQLEIISGGWVMNDEAVTHYQSTIDQMTWGFRKLNDTFGKCGRPHIGWQIDPFGHSREQASMFAQMGFDGLFIGRLDYQDKKLRLGSKTSEMVWRGSPRNLGSSSDLFTHVLFNNYGPPPGFCFDLLCEDEPLVSNKKSPLYNIPDKVEKFISYVWHQAKSYRSNDVVLTMGEDFKYQAAHTWFKNMDQLIRHVNEQQKNGSKVNVFYSSPSCYLKAVHDSNNSYSTKGDDFFPYADGQHSYWTGYYTSKPTIKYYERLGNNFLQVCKQLYAMADLGPEDRVDLNRMREAMGVLQHHDAITGTEKDHVAYDYARQLAEGFKECAIITGAALNKFFLSGDDSTTKTTTPPQPPPTIVPPPSPAPLESCLLLNISQCDVSETAKSFVVTLYNPLAHPVTHYVRLPVASKSSYIVQDPTGAQQTVQMVPIPNAVINLPGRTSSSFTELVFRAVDLPPLGFRSYYVAATGTLSAEEVTRSVFGEAVHRTSLGNKKLRLKLDGTGRTTDLQSNGLTMPLAQTFGYYAGYRGDNDKGNRASGAYIFRPNGTLVPVPLTGSKVYKGPLVEEVHQTYGDGWIAQTVRVYAGENHAEFEWQVGPIPVDSTYKVGREVVTRYTTDLQSEGVFHTDSNGRELIKRMRNYRPTWKVDLHEKIAGNYYPVTSRILIREEGKNQEIAVLPDRAEGGSSLMDGEIELMLNRRLLVDDGLGVAEALNETRYGTGLVARGRHYVIAGPITGVKPSLAAQERALVQEKLLRPWVFLSRADGVSFEQWRTQHKMELSGLSKALPGNVHLLTLEPWKGRSLLVRLEHILEKDEDAELSQPVTVDLKNVFSGFSIVSARETTLGGNQWLKDSERLQWRSESNAVGETPPTTEGQNALPLPLDIESVTLQPMQIRTFVVEIGVPS